MTEITPPTVSASRVKSLELANQHVGEKPEAIVARAAAYHTFLSGTAAAPKPAAPVTNGAKPPAAATGAPVTKPGPAAPKPAAAKPDAAKAGAAAPAGGKPKPAAAKTDAAKAGSASAQAVPGDTKAPGGTFTYAEVVAKLRSVQDGPGLGRDKAFAILSEAGGGVRSVRDLKPTLYDAVVKGCVAALNPPAADDDALGDPPEHTAGGLDADASGVVEDPTAQPERDDLGL